MSEPDPAISPAPHLAEAIARAERRRAMLERLAEIGMAVAEDLGARLAQAGEDEAPRRELGRVFVGVSRAVRFTLALEASVDEQILAMRNGDFEPGKAAREGGAASVALDPVAVAAVAQAVSKDSPSPHRNRVRDAVWEAINQGVGDIETARETLDALHERLIEGEDYNEFLSRPFRECVQLICASLGLSPDWSRWSDEAGFARPEGPRYNWPSFWRPEDAERRRQRRAERLAAAPRLE